jgi:hypothetical protein
MTGISRFNFTLGRGAAHRHKIGNTVNSWITTRTSIQQSTRYRDECVWRDETVDCAVEAVDLVEITVGGVVAFEAADLEEGPGGSFVGCFWLKLEGRVVSVVSLEEGSLCVRRASLGWRKRRSEVSAKRSIGVPSIDLSSVSASPIDASSTVTSGSTCSTA